MPSNVNSMFYVKQEPWHKQGVRVESALTSEEAIIKAGLDYEVAKIPTSYAFGDENRIILDKYATVRTDTGVALGVVGKIYNILQNKDAFRFFDGIVGVKEAMYDTAGALGKGERVWLLAKLPDYIRTAGNDITEKFLLLSNSHDGSSTVEVLFTGIRVVCENTLNIALSNATNKVSLRHTASVGLKLDDVRKTLGLANQKFQLLEDLSKKLTKIRITSKQLIPLIKESGVVPNVNDDELSGRAKNIIEEVSRLFETGRGADLESAKGTAWGAWNSIIEYVDFYRGGKAENRASSLLFGSGAKIKQKAWEKVVALL